MENTKNYVIAEVGFEGLFEAMVAQAEADVARAEVVAQEIAKKAEVKRKDALLLAQAQELAEDAKQGLAEWLIVLRKLDIADAVIG